jgi:hypothetical protein
VVAVTDAVGVVVAVTDAVAVALAVSVGVTVAVAVANAVIVAVVVAVADAVAAAVAVAVGGAVADALAVAVAAVVAVAVAVAVGCMSAVPVIETSVARAAIHTALAVWVASSGDRPPGVRPLPRVNTTSATTAANMPNPPSPKTIGSQRRGGGSGSSLSGRGRTTGVFLSFGNAPAGTGGSAGGSLSVNGVIVAGLNTGEGNRSGMVASGSIEGGCSGGGEVRRSVPVRDCSESWARRSASTSAES